MNEYTLKKLYGEDYIPQQTETNGALLAEEETWYEKHCPNKEMPYDYQYVLQGIRARRKNYE